MTEMEDTHLGSASDAAKAEVAQFAQCQADHALTTAENVVDAVAEEAREQGLTIEAAKSAAGEISEKSAVS